MIEEQRKTERSQRLREETWGSGGTKRKEDRQRERERDGKEEDAWSGQDRRANGGHRTEMASGSAFQYSTLATLGRPTSSGPTALLVLQHPRRLFPSRTHRLILCARSIFFSLSPSASPSLPACLFLTSRERRPPSPPRSHPSQTEAQHPPLDLESFYFAPPHS